MGQQVIAFSTRLQNSSHPRVLHNILYAGPASVRKCVLSLEVCIYSILEIFGI
jgi:hypothetical protein